MTNNEILEALRTYAVVAEAQAALDAATQAAADAVPLLTEHGVLSDEGTLTAMGEAALAMLAAITPERPTARKGGNGYASRVTQSDPDAIAWVVAELREDPTAGWSKLQTRYHDAGFASGWPRFRDNLYPAGVAAYEAEQAEAVAADEPKSRTRKAS